MIQFLQGPERIEERVKGGLVRVARAQVALPDGRLEWVAKRIVKSDTDEAIKAELTEGALAWAKNNPVE